MLGPTLTDDQQVLYDEIVRRANDEARGDYAATLAAYARAGNDPADIEAVRLALFGAHRPTSSDAVMSLIVGLVGLFVCPIPFLGAAAVAYGLRANRQTSTGVKAGHGMALAGQLLGWINVIMWLLVIVAAVVGGWSADRPGNLVGAPNLLTAQH